MLTIIRRRHTQSPILLKIRYKYSILVRNMRYALQTLYLPRIHRSRNECQFGTKVPIGGCVLMV